MDIVSIIIPVFNKKDYLLKSIGSVLEQSYENIEVILIDDGSNDGSSEICDEIGHQDKRVICFHQKNQGVSAARNRGIEIATGRYIMFFDADDYAEPKWVECLLDSIQNGNCSLGICGVKKEGFFWGGGHKFDKDAVVSASTFCDLLNTEFLSALWDKIFDLDIIKKEHIRFDVNTSMWEDLLFNMDYLLSLDLTNDNISCCSSVLYHYQSVPTGLSKRYTPWKYAAKQIREKICLLERKYGMQETLDITFYHKRCCDWCFLEIHYHTRNNSVHRCIKALKILLQSPEYQVMVNCDEFRNYSTARYQKIIKSGNCFLILIYNKLAVLREGIK